MNIRTFSRTPLQRCAVFAAGFACLGLAVVNLRSQGCVPSPAGAVDWWPGDGDAGDLVGGNSGQFAGTAVTSPGRVGLCFQFGANGDGVLIGNPASLQLQNFTIEAWIRRSNSTSATLDTTGNGAIFGYGYNGYAFAVYDDGRLLLTKVGVGGINSTIAIKDTDWHHVAVTKAGGDVNFYIDGVHEGPQRYDPGFGFASNAMIGGVALENVRSSFLGFIDEASLYNRELTAIEVQSIFNAGSFGKCRPPAVAISPGTGPFQDSAAVTISANTTNGLIRYTLDGSLPSSDSPIYQGPISITNTTIIEAQLFLGAASVSPVASVTLVRIDPSKDCVSINGLLGWWPGDGSGVDIIGHHDGILVGPTLYSNGEAGQAFNFAGNGAEVVVGNPLALQLQSFTIEAWIRRNRNDVTTPGTSGSGAIFGYGWNGYAFGTYNDGRLLLSKVGASGVDSRTGVNDLNWHHVAVTKTGSAVVFYLDGVSVGEQLYDPGFAFTSNAAIGAAGEVGSGFLGSIDEVKVYNQGLDPARILEHFFSAAFGQCSPPTVTISPNGGPFTNSVTVTLTTSATNGVIRYSLDGSGPSSSSPEYRGQSSSRTRPSSPRSCSPVRLPFLRQRARYFSPQAVRPC